MGVWVRKLPLPAVVLIGAVFGVGLVYAISLAGGGSQGSDLTVGAAGYISERLPGADPRQDAYPIPVAPASPDQSPDSDDAGGPANGGGTLVDQVVPPPPPPPPPYEPGQPDITIWRDRPDDGYIAGSGAGPITGRVTDPWGNGIPGVAVELDMVATYCYKACPNHHIPVFTDSLGYYKIESETYRDGPYYPEEYSFYPSTFDSGPAGELKGSHTVYFFGYVQGVPASEWYNNQKDFSYFELGYPAASTAVPAGSAGVDAVLVPNLNLSGHIISDAPVYHMDILIYRAGSPELVSSTIIGDAWFDPKTFMARVEPGDYKLLAIPVGSYFNPTDIPDTSLGTWFRLVRNWAAATAIHIEKGNSYTVDFRLLPPAPIGDDAIRGNLKLDYYWNSGYVLPFPGTTISLVEAGDPSAVIASKQVSASDFSFEFTDLPRGGYKLKCTFPGNGHEVWYTRRDGFDRDYHEATFSDATVFTTGAGQSIAPFLFYIKPAGGVMEGRVMFPDGSPVTMAVVEAVRLSEPGISSALSTIATTENDGSYHFCTDPYYNLNDIDPGTHEFCVRAGFPTLPSYCPGLIRNFNWFDVAPVTDIIVPDDFGQPFGASGRVVYDDGSPASGIEVRFTDKTGYRSIKAVTDSDGHYSADRTEGLLAGDYSVCAPGGGGEQCLKTSWGAKDFKWLIWGRVCELEDLILTKPVGMDGYQ